MDRDVHWLVVVTSEGHLITHERYAADAGIEAVIRYLAATRSFPHATVILYDLGSGQVTRARTAPAPMCRVA
jgi:hypothetical protein